MEWWALSNEELSRLAQADPTLAPYFVGVFASDHLPTSPHRQGPQAYVVNTDPHRRPGQHWLALWTPGDDTCEIMDSFGLPLEQYGSRPLEAWLARHWKAVDTNRTTLQALTSWTCGHYVLMYLMLKSRGQTLTQFLNRFSRHDYRSYSLLSRTIFSQNF